MIATRVNPKQNAMPIIKTYTDKHQLLLEFRLWYRWNVSGESLVEFDVPGYSNRKCNIPYRAFSNGNKRADIVSLESVEPKKIASSEAEP